MAASKQRLKPSHAGTIRIGFKGYLSAVHAVGHPWFTTPITAEFVVHSKIAETPDCGDSGSVSVS